ncbi:MAG: HD domain-containing protein [Armatimonadota bacterium]
MLELDPEATASLPKLDGRLAAAVDIGHSWDFDAEHAFQVGHLALRIHDQLQYRHHRGQQCRELLMCAALLHDVGLKEGPEDHHRRSRDIILQSDLRGFSTRECAIVAEVARYHRGDPPSLQHKGFAGLHPADRELVRRLAGVLRVADGLDQSHRTVVEDVRLRPGSNPVPMTLVTRADADVEMMAALKRSDLFETVYGPLAIEISQGS